MAQRKIVWSHRAKIKLYELLKFYAERNKNTKYSAKLYREITFRIKLLKKYPEMGRKTEKEYIRALIIKDYPIFYELTFDQIIIHTIWDNRQNPDEINI